jgi:pyruvate ferredoxin oxidoreductase delta subunit
MINGHFRPEVIAALDTSHDGRLDRRELKLDTESKRKTMERLLMAAGVNNPVIRAEVNTRRISHGVTAKSQALSDCLACHGPNSRIKDSVVLASFAPDGIAPVTKNETPAPGLIDIKPSGKVVFKPQSEVSQNFHVFGLTSADWTDRLGLLMLLGVVLTVAVHAGFRVATRRGRTVQAFENAAELETVNLPAMRPRTVREKCTKCGQCYSLCPDMAYSKDDEGYYTQNYNWCKGCGTCAQECPVDAITMTQEVD